jgi:hypothetical protein
MPTTTQPTHAQALYGWTCLNDPGWRVYGFPMLNLLVFSTESEIPIHDGVKLELAQRSNTRSWTSGMEEAHLQVCRFCLLRRLVFLCH